METAFHSLTRTCPVRPRLAVPPSQLIAAVRIVCQAASENLRASPPARRRRDDRRHQQYDDDQPDDERSQHGVVDTDEPRPPTIGRQTSIPTSARGVGRPTSLRHFADKERDQQEKCDKERGKRQGGEPGRSVESLVSRRAPLGVPIRRRCFTTRPGPITTRRSDRPEPVARSMSTPIAALLNALCLSPLPAVTPILRPRWVARHARRAPRRQLPSARQPTADRRIARPARRRPMPTVAADCPPLRTSLRDRRNQRAVMRTRKVLDLIGQRARRSR